MKAKKTPYLTSAELAKALEESQKLGRPTVEVCKHFRTIAQHLLGDSRYVGYKRELQEDMMSAALIKCIKNIKNYKPEFKDRCFNYFTRAAEMAFWEVLGKHYKHVNQQRQLVLDYADIIEPFSPSIAQQLRDSQIEPEHTKRLANLRFQTTRPKSKNGKKA